MRRQSLFVPGPLPGLNEWAGRATRWNYGNLKKQWGQTIGHCILQQKLKPVPRAALIFHWQEQHRRRDHDNIRSAAKFILDALVTMKILPGDGWTSIASLTDYYAVVPAHPGVLVLIDSQPEEAQP
jgi:hypothetical protein